MKDDALCSASGKSLDSDVDDESLTRSKKLKMMNCNPSVDSFNHQNSNHKNDVMDYNENVRLGTDDIKNASSVDESAISASACRVCSNEADKILEPTVNNDDNANVNNYYVNRDEIDNKNVDSIWTSTQLELLVSAIPSYKFLPRTTVQTLHKDLVKLVVKKEDKAIITRKFVKDWFDAHSDNYDHLARTEKILKTIKVQNNNETNLKENFDAKKFENRQGRRLTFSGKVQSKTFNIHAPAKVFLTEQEAKNDQGMEYPWSVEQLEVLETAVDAYKYFPKIVVRKVCKELREMSVGRTQTFFNTGQVAKWFRNAKNGNSDEEDEDGFDILQKINDDNDMEVEDQIPRTRKIQFLSRVQINLFDTSSPASPFVECFQEEFKD